MVAPSLVVPTYSAVQVKAAEVPALQAGEPLMIRAATALATVIADEVAQPENQDGPRALFLIGGGNNGGDALYAAAQLAKQGAHVLALPVSDRMHPEAAAEARSCGVRFISADELGTAVRSGDSFVNGGAPNSDRAAWGFPAFDVVVDGILGTGTSSNPALRGTARAVVEQIIAGLDPARTRIVAVDIPSGLHPDTGQSDGIVLPADVTVTFGGVKQGLAAPGANELVGALVLVDIGIGDEMTRAEPTGQARVQQVIDATQLPLPEPYLRPLRPEDDCDVLTAFLSNPDMERQGGVASLEESQRYIGNLMRPGVLSWAVTVHGRLIGLVAIDVDESNGNGWFFYWMADEARGRGWAGRAAATAANWALSEGGLHRLELGHRVTNPASGGVARAAGFVKEGTERKKFLVDGQRIDVDTYGRLRTDPVPATGPFEMRDS